MKLRNAYCSYSAFEEIYTFNEDYPELYKILSKHCSLTIDLSEDELEKRIFKSPVLKSFYKESGKINTKPEIFEQVPDKIDFANYPGSLFIVDVPEKECEAIRKKFGVLTISSKEMNRFTSLVSPAVPWSWTSGDTKTYSCPTGKTYKGWGAILRPFTCTQPLSAANLIINDAYIFQSDDIEIIADNIFSLTKGFLSDNLKGEMQVLIVGGSSKKGQPDFYINSATIDKIFGKLNSLKAAIQHCNVRFGILTYEIDNFKFSDLHERFIIADYSICTSHYGFLEFIEEKAQRSNDLNYQWSYYNVCNNNGSDIPLKKMQTKLQAIEELRKLNQTMKSTSTHFHRGHTDNRLLNL